MFAPVRCCFDVMFLLFASLFALKKLCVTVHEVFLHDSFELNCKGVD